MKKSIISVILCVLLVFSVMPGVFAETEQIDFVKLAKVTAYRVDSDGEREELSGAENVQKRFYEMTYAFATNIEEDNALPIYMEFDFNGMTIAPERFKIYVRYAYYCGINEIKLEYMDNGEWKTAKDNISFNWKEPGEFLECNDIVLSERFSSDRFRLVFESINPTSSVLRIDNVSVLGKMSNVFDERTVRPEYKRVTVGSVAALPKKVTILRGDKEAETTSYEIVWKAVDTSKAGTYTVYGATFGGAVKVKGIVDVYDPSGFPNTSHWANNLIVTAKKYGYIQGIAENPDAVIGVDDAARIMFRMFNMNFEFPQSYEGEDGDEFYQTVRKYIPQYDEKNFSRVKAFSMLAKYASGRSYEKEVTELAFDDISTLSEEKLKAAKAAAEYGIINNSGTLRAEDNVTLAEFLKMCFNLKKTCSFETISLNDNGRKLNMINSGKVVSCEENTDDADVIYIKRNKADLESGGKYDFSYINTQIAKCRKNQKKVAICITGADEAMIAALAEKYGRSDRIAFIDAESLQQTELWQKFWREATVYLAEGRTRGEGRYSFDESTQVRILPTEISYSKSCNHDEAFLFNINWQNLCATDADKDLYPSITLKTQQGNAAAVLTDANFNLKQLKNGSKWQNFVHQVHSDLGGDIYKAYLSLGSITGEPTQELPIDLPDDGEGRYYIGDIRLQPMCKVDVLGIDEENNMKVKVSFSDVAGEYDLNDDGPWISFILREPGKKLFSSSGDMALYEMKRKDTPGFKEALLNRTSFEAEFPIVMKDELRGKKVTRDELVGRIFELWSIPSAYTAGDDQWTVIGDEGTMKLHGYITIKQGKTADSYSYLFEAVK